MGCMSFAVDCMYWSMVQAILNNRQLSLLHIYLYTNLLVNENKLPKWPFIEKLLHSAQSLRSERHPYAQSLNTSHRVVVSIPRSNIPVHRATKNKPNRPNMLGAFFVTPFFCRSTANDKHNTAYQWTRSSSRARCSSQILVSGSGQNGISRAIDECIVNYGAWSECARGKTNSTNCEYLEHSLIKVSTKLRVNFTC